MEKALLVAIACAGLMGAAGVALAAAGAHGKPGTGLDSAGYILLVHAAAVLGAAAAVDGELVHQGAGATALTAFVLGASLFACDVALRVYTGGRLFPMAAPTGGIVLIIGWLAMTVAATANLIADR
jgi:uncharacterized membrane protein YgdD (TMEM256/DUF423 family)